jgi:hypothetical protein
MLGLSRALAALKSFSGFGAAAGVFDSGVLVPGV